MGIKMSYVLNSAYAESQKSIIRDSRSTPDDLKRSINALGEEIGRKLIVDHFLFEESITTPMNSNVRGFLPKIPLCAIITTRDDFAFLGKGISSTLQNSISGYMDFEGQRGVQALNANIRHMELPELKGQHVHTLIIAKAVLATGCTATHLAKVAINTYMPRQIIITSIFYSEHAVAELNHEIPNADILTVGVSDTLNEDGMLVPGIGNLDQRLRA
jgi:uracil phosphoribosyltransferase